MSQTLINTAREKVNLRREWLEHALQAKEAIEKLPQELKELEHFNSDTDTSYNGGTNIVFTLPFGENPDSVDARTEELSKIMGTCSKAGVVWRSKAEVNSYNGRFNIYGMLFIEDDKYIFTIKNLDTPPTCKLVEKRKRKVVTVYEAECIEGTE